MVRPAEDDLPPFAGCGDDDGDGVGECLLGPDDSHCTVASGHAQRGCLSDGECGGGPNTCEVTRRRCFPTGSGSFQPGPSFVGTDTLVAHGVTDPPTAGISAPTLASVFCVGPTGSSPLNNAAGLPGPVRLTIGGRMVEHP
jgi:hypothetical protein